MSLGRQVKFTVAIKNGTEYPFVQTMNLGNVSSSNFYVYHNKSSEDVETFVIYIDKFASNFLCCGHQCDAFNLLFLDATISNVTNGFRTELISNNVNICESVSDDSYRCERHLDPSARTYVDLEGYGTLTSIRVFAEGKDLHSCVG